MITPTIGRVVLIRNRDGNSTGQDEPAFICYVHGPSTINVGGFDAFGNPFSLKSITLEGDDEYTGPGAFAAWMPYQKQQAVKDASK